MEYFTGDEVRRIIDQRVDWEEQEHGMPPHFARGYALQFVHDLPALMEGLEAVLESEGVPDDLRRVCEAHTQGRIRKEELVDRLWELESQMRDVYCQEGLVFEEDLPIVFLRLDALRYARCLERIAFLLIPYAQSPATEAADLLQAATPLPDMVDLLALTEPLTDRLFSSYIQKHGQSAWSREELYLDALQGVWESLLLPPLALQSLDRSWLLDRYNQKFKYTGEDI